MVKYKMYFFFGSVMCKKIFFVGLLTAATVLPLVKATGRKDASFEDLMNNHGDDGFRYECYNNERYRKYMEHLLPYFDKLGLLD